MKFVNVICNDCETATVIPQMMGLTIYTKWVCKCGTTQNVYKGQPELKVGGVVIKPMKNSTFSVKRKKERG